MKIGIYARGLSEHSGGVKEYIKNISKHIIKNNYNKNKIYIIHNCKKKQFQSNNKSIKEILMKSNSKLLCDYIISPYLINKYKLDVVIFTKNLVPFFIKSKSVLVIHDLAYLIPKLNAYKFIDTLYWKMILKISAKKASKIVAISKNTKNDITKLLNIKKEKIKVIHEAADEKYKKIKNKNLINKFKRKYNLKKSFILYSGNLSPRKNILRTIKAFNLISKKINYNFIITGNKLWKYKKILKAIDKNEKIKLLGFIPDDEMPALYNSAKLLIYPSLYEGFGLPILEAQKCGCPVINSNKSSLPEVANKSTIMFDPRNTEEISKTILKSCKNQKLKKELISKGYKNTFKFSWDKCAKQLIKLCKEVTNEK